MLILQVTQYIICKGWTLGPLAPGRVETYSGREPQIVYLLLTYRIFYSTLFSTMAQITFQLTSQLSTPSCSPEPCTDFKRRETDSLKKSRFFDVYDRGKINALSRRNTC